MSIMKKNRPSSGLTLFATIIAAALVSLAPQFLVSAQPQGLLPGVDAQGGAQTAPPAT